MVAVQDFTPPPAVRQADAEIFADHRSEIAGHNHGRRFRCLSYINEDTKLGTGGVDPFETHRIAVQLVQGRMVPVERVEIADEFAHAAMNGVIQMMPIEAPIVVPFALLRELASHEEKLLAR